MDTDSKTIADFGDQWALFTGNEGYYGSLDLLKDFFGPLLSVNDLKGKTVIDIGSGTGRIVNMLLDAGAGRVIAVEPSGSMDICKKNTTNRKDQVEYFQVRGDEIPDLGIPVDYITSIGVIHHIEDPLPVVMRCFELLKPGGRCLFWLYGCEGNEAYLRIALPLRKTTQRMPDWMLVGLSHLLNVFLGFYIFLCRFIPLPLHQYLTQVLAKLDWQKRMTIVFDQLNPAYAKYYSKAEAENLMRSGGFKNVEIFHRHGYSWTVIGEK